MPRQVRLTTRQKIGLARALQRPLLAARHLSGRSAMTTVRRRGVTWHLDLREGIDFAIWLQGCFEVSTVAAYRRILQPGMTVIDVGANIGAHTLHLARATGRRGTVVACEPTEDAFSRLVANVSANPNLAPAIRPMQVMLLAGVHSRLPERVVSSWPLRVDEDVDEVTRGRPKPTSGAAVTTIDNLVATECLSAVDLIKLDVDGYECDVLDGAVGTLARHQPTIVAEIAPHALEAMGRTVDDLLDRMAALGYRLERLRGAKPVLPADIGRLRNERRSINVIARGPRTGG